MKKVNHFKFLGCAIGSALALGSGSLAVAGLGDDNEVCRPCNEAELRGEIDRLTSKYGKDVNAAATKAGIELTKNDVEVVMLGLLASGKDEGCKFSFETVRKQFSSKAEKEKFLNVGVLTRSVPILGYHAKSEVTDPVTTTVTKPAPPPVDVDIPKIENPFPDCVSDKFSAQGKAQYDKTLQSIVDHLSAGGTIKTIDVECSASTYSNNSCPPALRPKDALDLSTKRCEFMRKQLLADINRHVTRLNAEAGSDGPQLNALTYENIAIHPGGQNGDGTSGPLPPNGVNSCSVEGNGEEPHKTKAEYDQYKYANVRMVGESPLGTAVVETFTKPGKEDHVLDYVQPRYSCISHGKIADRTPSGKRGYTGCANQNKKNREAKVLAAKQARYNKRAADLYVDKRVQSNAKKGVLEYNSGVVENTPVTGSGSTQSAGKVD